MKSFGEGHGQFMAPWEFRAVFMDSKSNARWHAGASWFDLELAKRAIKTKSGASPFKYLDGAQHVASYQYASRIEEDIYCKNEPEPASCRTARAYDKEAPNGKKSVVFWELSLRLPTCTGMDLAFWTMESLAVRLWEIIRLTSFLIPSPTEHC